jgi:hypothetical protein
LRRHFDARDRHEIPTTIEARDLNFIDLHSLAKLGNAAQGPFVYADDDHEGREKWCGRKQPASDGRGVKDSVVRQSQSRQKCGHTQTPKPNVLAAPDGQCPRAFVNLPLVPVANAFLPRHVRLRYPVEYKSKSYLS